MSDIFCYDGTTCRVSDEVQELRERVRTLEAQLAAVTQDEQINTIEALRKLRVLLSDDGGYADLSPDSPLRQERKVTIRYGDGGSSAQLVRWVGNLADEFREEIRAAVPTQPIDLTGPAEAPLISQILAAAVAAQSDPEPDPEPEQPDAGDDDHGATGETMDDFLSGMEGDAE